MIQPKHAIPTAVLALLALATHGAAETLDDAWTDAIASHPQISAAGALRDAADHELEEARAMRLPQLGLSTGYTMLNEAPGFSLDGINTGPVFRGDDFVTAGAELRVPVFTGGAINAGIDAAESARTAAGDQLATVIQDIKLGVAEHYVGVLRAESAVTVAESYVASLRAHTENARERYEVGDVPQNDYLAASVTLAAAEQRLLQANNGLDYARAAYNRFLGRPLDAPVSLDPTLGIEGLPGDAESLDELIANARLNRRELAALDAQRAALERRADSELARARPQLAVTGGYMYLENDFLTRDEFAMAGIGVTWNLFDGGRSRKKSAATARRAAAVAYRRDDLASMIELQVRRASNDREEAESRLNVAERAVSQAVENLRVVRNRYAAGASTNTEVLDAEALHEQALSNRDTARFEVQLAKLRLARATGAL